MGYRWKGEAGTAEGRHMAVGVMVAGHIGVVESLVNVSFAQF